MMQVTVKALGFAEVRTKLNAMRNDLRDRAASAALNKVGDKARTEMRRAVTDEYNLKASEVASRLQLSRATRDNLCVVLDPFASGRKGRALNLIHFLEKKVSMAMARRRSKTGQLYAVGRNSQKLPILYFKIKRNEPAKPIFGTFIGNHGRTVFMRIGKSRLPIEAASTIGVPQMFNARKIQARVLDRINRELPIEFERAIRMVLERYT